jgi:plastocyanin
MKEQAMKTQFSPSLFKISLAGIAATAALAAGATYAFQPAAPALVLVKTADINAPVRVGDSFSYRLVVLNNTERAIEARLIDVLPREVSLNGSASITSTGILTPAGGLSTTLNPEVVGWHGELAPGARLHVSIPVTLQDCPPVHFGPPYDGARAVRNAATLQAGPMIQVATHAFAPFGCAAVTPTARPTMPRPTALPGVEVGVRKHARLHPDYDEPERGWVASWFVAYGNRGTEVATDVSLVDQPSANQTIAGVRSAPLLTPTLEGDSYVFAVGDLAAQRGGGILMRARLPFSTAAGTVLTNAVSITATGDGSTLNNRDLVTLTVPYLPPLITYPRSGATCTGTITITGRAQAASAVEVVIDGTRVATVTADAEGFWTLPVALNDGAHTIGAQTHSGNGEARRSPPVLIRVDSALLWDPISLTFVGPEGVRRHPRHWMGWMNEVGWYIGLAPSTTYTMAVRICCDDSATVTATIPGKGVIDLTDPNGDKIYTATFTTGTARELLSGPIGLCVAYNGELQCARGRIVPTWARGRHHVIVITPNGFEPNRAQVRPGDTVEFINMGDSARSISARRNLLSAAGVLGANGADAGAADDDAFTLEVGESYSLEVQDMRSVELYDAADGASITLAVGSVYLPAVVR